MKPWEANIRRVTPYVPGEQPKDTRMIKLNTNENPYPPAPEVARMLQEMDMDAFRKYPDPTASVLVEALAEYYELEKNQIFVGVGSDDVLGMAFLTFFNSNKPVLFPDVTYSFYPVWADLYRIPYETPELDENFCIHPQDFYKENGGVILANPNAPTGIALPLEQIENILAHNQDVVVVVDEAYVDFGGESALPLIEKYENLLVVQTFSKSRSMAGMRIGFAAGNPALIQAMQDIKYSYNSYTMNLPSILLGAEAVKDKEYFHITVQKIIKTREEAKLRLEKLGFICLDSATNFIFVSHKTAPAARIYQALREQQIYVRYFNLPRLDNHLRITIGTDEEMQMMYDFLETFLE